MLTDYNNLQCFIDTKNLHSRYVYQAQKLSKYHFRIDYCQSKANKATDALLQYTQQSVEEKMLYYQGLSYILKIINSELIST